MSNPSFIICGIEHSGTTLLSELFNQTKKFSSGFEIGVLLCNSPKAFIDKEPYITNFCKSWDISREDVNIICDSDSYMEFYKKITFFSNVAKQTGVFFDKTPRYIAVMDKWLHKVEKPIIVTYKDPRAIVLSDFKRSGANNFDQWYATYLPMKKAYMENIDRNMRMFRGNDRVLLISLEQICLSVKASCLKMFEHVGEKFRYEYLCIANKKFNNVYSNSIDSSIPFHYMKSFSPETCKQIENDFGLFEDWFYF